MDSFGRKKQALKPFESPSMKKVSYVVVQELLKKAGWFFRRGTFRMKSA